MHALSSAAETLVGTSAALRDHDRTRALLIAGNTYATETLAELLEALGYDIETAPTGRAARRQRAPEIVIADACLPDGGAPEVLRALRRLPGWGSVPAIALGGFSAAQAERAEAAGFAAVLPKPISIWALHRAVQDALQGRVPRRSLRW